jgi:hypothetical protein
MQNNVTPLSSPRILAMRVRNTIRIPTPTQSIVVPIAELPLFVALSAAIAARHQRGARLQGEVTA